MIRSLLSVLSFALVLACAHSSRAGDNPQRTNYALILQRDEFGLSKGLLANFLAELPGMQKLSSLSEGELNAKVHVHIRKDVKIEKLVNGKREPAGVEDIKKGACVEIGDVGQVLQSKPAIIFPGSILIVSSGPKLYVGNFGGNDLHIIDTATNKVIKRVEVGPEPHGLAATASGDRIFITIENVHGDNGELLWYDPATETVTKRIKVGPRPNQLACTPDGKFVYVPCDDACWWVVDGIQGTVITKIPTGGRPHNTLCSTDGKTMFLGPKASYHVLMADVATHKLIGEIPLSDAPRPIVLSKDGKRLYANVDTLIGFEVADIPSRKLVHRVLADVPEDMLRVPSRSHGIGLKPGEKELWMCDVFHERTYVFDLTVSPPKQVGSIAMKGGGYWMCFSPDGRFCYISERIGDTVAVIDTESRQVVARIAVGKMPKRNLVLFPITS